MSKGFLLAIAVLYLGAAVSFALERDARWTSYCVAAAVLNLCVAL